MSVCVCVSWCPCASYDASLTFNVKKKIMNGMPRCMHCTPVYALPENVVGVCTYFDSK